VALAAAWAARHGWRMPSKALSLAQGFWSRDRSFSTLNSPQQGGAAASTVIPPLIHSRWRRVMLQHLAALLHRNGETWSFGQVADPALHGGALLCPGTPSPPCQPQGIFCCSQPTAVPPRKHIALPSNSLSPSGFQYSALLMTED